MIGSTHPALEHIGDVRVSAMYVRRAQRALEDYERAAHRHRLLLDVLITQMRARAFDAGACERAQRAAEAMRGDREATAMVLAAEVLEMLSAMTPAVRLEPAVATCDGDAAR